MKRAHARPSPAAAAADYGNITSLTNVPDALETHLLFSGAVTRSALSPIDEFISNTDALNALALRANPLPRELSTLLLLGYMSAVESFVRSLIRAVVNLDEVAMKCAEPKLVPFGAALHHAPEMLAEALLEGHSFSSKQNVVDALKDYLGIKQIANEMAKMLDEYQTICELRHCCVHRFGKLGAKNAIALGLANHRACLEQPLSLDSASFQELALRLRTFAKGLNNIVFSKILERTATNKNDNGGGPLYTETWSWSYRRDRKRFVAYYRVFASTRDAIPSPPERELYELFRNRFQSAVTARRPRTA